MNNEKKKNNKKLYIALLICTVVAIIAIVATSIALGITAGQPSGPVDHPGGITDPTNPDDPVNPGDPTNPDDPVNPDDPDVPTGDTPKYGMPIAEYTLGQECKLSELVWSNTLHWYATHNGTDFTAAKGTAVCAIYDGTVSSVKYTTQDGYVITITQSDGLTASYKSLSGDTLVEEGDKVTTGTPIGYVSDTMQSEQNDGAHLHLELKDESGAYLDPMTKLPENGTEK